LVTTHHFFQSSIRVPPRDGSIFCVPLPSGRRPPHRMSSRDREIDEWFVDAVQGLNTVLEIVTNR
jgi:hypothetical protein